MYRRRGQLYNHGTVPIAVWYHHSDYAAKVKFFCLSKLIFSCGNGDRAIILLGKFHVGPASWFCEQAFKMLSIIAFIQNLHVAVFDFGAIQCFYIELIIHANPHLFFAGRKNRRYGAQATLHEYRLKKLRITIVLTLIPKVLVPMHSNELQSTNTVSVLNAVLN